MRIRDGWEYGKGTGENWNKLGINEMKGMNEKKEVIKEI